MKSIFKKFFFILLSAFCALQLVACNVTTNNDSNRQSFNSSSDNYWNNNSSENDNSSLDTDVEPNIDITVIGGETKEQEISNEIEQKKITNIESLIYSSVQKNLESDGFTVKTGVASVAENSTYSSLGLYYYDDTNLKLYSTNSLRACGFIEVKKDTEEYYSLADEKSLIVISHVDYSNKIKTIDDETSNDETNDVVNIATYNYENINSYHFVYQNKYVQYYQQSGMRIVYSTFENKKSNYDLSYGSLYDYDNNIYLYDESIFGEYSTHSGTTLFSEEDYASLKTELETFSNQQLENGYKVDEYKIVYISPENIQTYINSTEEDTFFGYSVEELTQEFGLGTALEYTSDGFKTAQILTSEDTSYNWKSFLTKIGIGCGIILVGAILSPVTGGASFGCALITISKVAVTYALTSALGTVAIKAVEGLISGKSLTDTLKNMTYSGLDAFANGFMIGAAVGSVGLLTGVIKPSACFVSGTPVITSALGTTTAIENIKVGDYVWSYNQESNTNSYQKVTDIFEKEVNELIDLTINGNVITTTPNHPFYLPSYDVWVTADSLQNNDLVLLYDGSYGYVQNAFSYECENTIVYNFTVENNHTYYVGDEGVLVHNDCTTITSKRNKGVTEAWKKEKEAVINGTSKYNWSPSQIKEIMATGKVHGYDINGVHIVDVQALEGTANEYLISSSNNIVFLTRGQHLEVHGGCWKNISNTDIIVKYLPWASEQIKYVLGIVG